jgi:hypothetical protein
MADRPKSLIRERAFFISTLVGVGVGVAVIDACDGGMAGLEIGAGGGSDEELLKSWRRLWV